MRKDGKRWETICCSMVFSMFGESMDWFWLKNLPKDGLDQQEWAGNKPSTLGIGNNSVVE